MKNTQTNNSQLNSLIVRQEFSETSNVLQDDSGYHLELHEITLNQIGIKWGKYSCPYGKKLSFYPENNTVVSHFRITDSPAIVNKKRKSISERQFVVYREKPEPYDLDIAPTKEKGCTFFETGMTETLFSHLFSGKVISYHALVIMSRNKHLLLILPLRCFPRCMSLLMTWTVHPSRGI
jgi:hypothetical protein